MTQPKKPAAKATPKDTWPAFLTAHAEGVSLQLKVQPRASRTEIAEPLGDALRVRVTAPPVDSAANEAVLHLLAETLECPKNAIQLRRGQTARNKTFFIRGLTPAQVMERLFSQK